MIRSVTLEDAFQIAEIYNYYILNSYATFEVEPVDASGFSKRIEVIMAEYPWLIFEEGGEILGYAYASKFNIRSAYKHTVEVSIYLKNGKTSKGLGTLLYEKLLAILEEQNYHTIIGGVSLPNEASVRLHEKFGFKQVAYYKEVGYKFEQWVDVGYWQKLMSNEN